jgi:flagellar motor switch protein FliM
MSDQGGRAETSALGFAMEGERVQRAARVLERIGPLLASALRRAVPCLARRQVPVTLAFARTLPMTALAQDLPAPLLTTPLVVSPGGARGALVLDGGASALFLDGALGGNGSNLPVLSNTLSPAQTALVGRVAEGIVGAFDTVLRSRVGIRIQSDAARAEDAATEGALVACALEIGEGPIGRLVLLLPKEALLTREAPGEKPPAEDPRIAALLSDVEVSLVAELARVPMPLHQLAALKVGDTLRLGVGVGSLVSVRTEGRVVLRGKPTSSNGRIAIRVEGRHEP